MNKKIYLSSPTMHGEEMMYIEEAFKRNWVAPMGFNCDGFEQEIIEYLKKTGVGYNDELFSFASVSGTAAIHLALKLAGVKAGDIVLCSDMTFSATVNPVTYEGGIQVFVDSERETWNMDPLALEKAFIKYPKAKIVILAHLYGIPSKIDEIMSICRKYNAILIEDAAEALSATYKGQACGTFGDTGILSFNGNKIITTSGGGMIICKDKASRDKALFWATQAREPAPWYQHEDIGYNYRMSNIVAGIGRGQLKHLDEHRKLKEQIYKKYNKDLEELPISMNPYLEIDTIPNFWLSCLLINNKCKVGFMDIYNKLNEFDIESRPIWKPMHMQPFYRNNDFIYVENNPVDEYIFSRGLCLPSDIKMTSVQQDSVIGVIKKCFERK